MEEYRLRNEGKIGDDRTVKAITRYGRLVADNGRYSIYDLHVNELTLSLTALNRKRETRGHSHIDASEIYFFVEGNGRMRIGNREYDVEKGSVLLIPRGEYHKVSNLGNEKLLFVTVFEGDRSSKNYNFENQS
jgi:mannose-6-phosphate isomerase-like protein (cupin superfamily)